MVLPARGKLGGETATPKNSIRLNRVVLKSNTSHPNIPFYCYSVGKRPTRPRQLGVRISASSNKAWFMSRQDCRQPPISLEHARIMDTPRSRDATPAVCQSILLLDLHPEAVKEKRRAKQTRHNPFAYTCTALRLVCVKTRSV